LPRGGPRTQRGCKSSLRTRRDRSAAWEPGSIARSCTMWPTRRSGRCCDTSPMLSPAPRRQLTTKPALTAACCRTSYAARRTMKLRHSLSNGCNLPPSQAGDDSSARYTRMLMHPCSSPARGGTRRCCAGMRGTRRSKAPLPHARTGGVPMLKMMGGAPGAAGDVHDHRASAGCAPYAVRLKTTLSAPVSAGRANTS
jgi:hypothetical protein